MKRAKSMSLALVLGWACLATAGTAMAATAGKTGPSLPTVHAVLSSPPDVPPPITRRSPARVVVDLTVKEVKRQIADGVYYDFWTFGGTVPGSFIRVRQGDTVEFHLHNPAGSSMPHNIDLHAVTGPAGGGKASMTLPGHESVFSFKALKSGLFVYHCATPPVPVHIANGMYGLILVEPPQGLPRVDRAYYVMQGDFYTTGATNAKGMQSFDMQKLLDERPTYVLFNGRWGALTGKHALTAKVGQTVRLYVGNGGPNLVSSFHVIGEIFDRVWDGSSRHYQENVQTTLIPAGGAKVVQFKVKVPGTYLLVDHSITRAFFKGALGQLKVSGPAQPALFHPMTPPAAAPAHTSTPAPVKQAPARHEDVPPVAQATAPAGKAEQLAAGATTFQQICAACHQANGQGIPGVFPPLSGSDLLRAHPERALEIVTHGLSGPLTVNGTHYDSVMPAMAQLSDAQVAEVLSYVFNRWGYGRGRVDAAEVARVRARAVGAPASR